MTDKGFVHRQKDTFGKSPYLLLINTDISDGAARLYAYMHWRYGSNHDNHEGQQSMADALDRSARTIRNYLVELEQHSWIVVVERKTAKGRGTNFYHVFETQTDCQTWRKEHKIPLPNREAKKRKGRKGIGGNTEGKMRNSDSATPRNSSSYNPDSCDPDSITLAKANGGTVVSTPDSDEKSAQTSPPSRKRRARSAKQIELDNMVNAIADAFGLDHAKVTKTKWGEFRKAGRELLDVGATPADMKPLHDHCAKLVSSEFSSIYMAKEWAAFDAKRTSTPNPYATPTPPAQPKLPPTVMPKPRYNADGTPIRATS